MLKDKLQADLKTAMLARNTQVVEVLKSLKSAIMYAEVEQGKRDEGLDDTEIIVVFKKEAKKRQDAEVLYRKGGNNEQADIEKEEKLIIDAYLPPQLSEDEAIVVIDEVITNLGVEKLSPADMGRVIGGVKATGAEIDGSTLAKLVKERIGS